MPSPTKKEVLARIDGLAPDMQRRIVCALAGHSRVVTTFFGYVSCARCNEQIGDTRAGAFDLTRCVVVGHSCETCATVYAAMGWRDKLMAPDPEIVVPEGGWPPPEPAQTAEPRFFGDALHL